MNCTAAQKYIAKLVDGDLVEKERLDLDQHIAICNSCDELMVESLVFRQLASNWASDLAEATDPGEQMNARVLSAIAGRSPGTEVQARRRKSLSAILVITTFVAAIGLGFIVKLPAVPSYNIGSSVESLLQLLSDNKFLRGSQIPVAYSYGIIAGLLVINFMLYTKPVRRLLRAI